MRQAPDKNLCEIFTSLYQYFGPCRWWPADSPFEVAMGAILTQNTAWTNVEYAISNLKAADMLSAAKIASASVEEIEELIKPSGFFRQKAVYLQVFSRYLMKEWQGDLNRLFSLSLEKARATLLALKGIGPETADSILLYAGNQPSFVVDAYTRRIFARLGLLNGQETYDEVRIFFMQHLPVKTQLYNEYHALIVTLAKNHCKAKPCCDNCPIKGVCNYANNRSL